MSTKNDQLPEPSGQGVPEDGAETVGTALEVQQSPPAEPAPPLSVSRAPGLVLLAIFAAVLAIAGVLWVSRARAPSTQADAPDAQTPVSISLPTDETAAGEGSPGPGAHDAPGLPNPSPAKIFNDAASFKETIGQGATGETDATSAPSGEFITRLPPAPHVAPGGSANEALRDAAKNALKNNTPDSPLAEEPEASLQSEDARQLAGLEGEARRAMAFSALAAKARAGLPYTEELRLYLAERQDRPLPAEVADLAGDGAPTLSDLAISFRSHQRAALAAGRRAEASGPVERIAASLATLLQLRPSGPRTGAGTVAALSRAEAEIAQQNLSAALAELATLRPEAAAPLAGWKKDAKARLALEAALADREKALLAALHDGRL